MSRSKALESVLVISLALLVAYLTYKNTLFIYLAAGLMLLSVLSKSFTIGVGKLWFGFSHYFGMVMNTIIMGFIFFLILTPLAFLQRIFGKNGLKKSTSKDSYFIKRNHLFTLKDIEKPW